jgi:alpha-ketoglutarate-dependent taurine dioxygenase
MVKLEVRGEFAARDGGFFVDPMRDPSHYEALAAAVGPHVVSPHAAVEIRAQVHQYGYALISTDLADFAPPTPTSLSEPYAGPYYGEAMLALIGQVVGELQHLSHQHEGRVFHDVMPIEAYRDRQTSGSSDVVLEMHTELAFVANPPEYLMLFCVRQDQERSAETHLYDSRFALGSLTREQCQQLAQPRFRFGLDANITGSVEEKVEAAPILCRATARLLRYDLDLYRPSGDEYQGAFEALSGALLDRRISLRLKTGQLLLVDNKRMVHSRSKFKASYDGSDRWLKRALVRGT